MYKIYIMCLVDNILILSKEFHIHQKKLVQKIPQNVRRSNKPAMIKQKRKSRNKRENHVDLTPGFPDLSVRLIMWYLNLPNRIPI